MSEDLGGRGVEMLAVQFFGYGGNKDGGIFLILELFFVIFVLDIK